MEFLTDRGGVAAVWFGLTVPLVVAAVGLSVDMGQTYLMRERLSQALDAAALAAAGTPTANQQELEEKVRDFIRANYPEGKVGFHTNIEVEETQDTLYVKAWAELRPAFMVIFGKERIEVGVEAEVTKEVKALEVVLVMDVTGSMGTKKNGKTRLQNLQEAAHLFLDTMFRPNLDLETLKIGLVPFSASVNISRYGLGRTLNNLPYGPNVINNPRNIEWTTPGDNTTAGKRKWKGCVLENAAPQDQYDNSGPWNMYRYCRNSTPSSTSSSRIRDCDRVSSSDRYTSRDQNYLCPKTPIMPLTNNETALKTSISTLRAEGNTYINNGLAWGLRVISPEFPFAEGESWNNEDWSKAIILMTDGESTMHNYYSIYGPTASHSINANNLDNRILDVCDILKEKNVLIYTITFDDGVSADTKEIFESCATQPSMWYDAPTQAKLLEVYQTIARELANMHLSK